MQSPAISWMQKFTGFCDFSRKLGIKLWKYRWLPGDLKSLSSKIPCYGRCQKVTFIHTPTESVVRFNEYGCEKQWSWNIWKTNCLAKIWLLGERLAWAWPLDQCPHCKNTILKIWYKYSQKRNCATSVPISTVMSVELFIYSHDRSGKYVDQSWEYINRTQTHECGNWDWGLAIPFLGIHKRDFHCSAPCLGW